MEEQLDDKPSSKDASSFQKAWNNRTCLWSVLFSSTLLVAVTILSMRFIQPLQALAPFVIPGLAQPSSLHPSLDLESWIQAEIPIAFRGMLDNIGPTAADANPGIVVASPSRSDPDYYYTWTRDAALTYKCLIDALVAGQVDAETSIQNYVLAQARIQTVSNPSGDTCTGGLAEPKFNVDETAFTGAWGRPQRDGPALRAIALTSYANILLARGNVTLVADIVWPVIQNDLSYVALNWSEHTFDLWEEVDSLSFFTTAVQYRALKEGSILSQALGKSCSQCDSQSPLILCTLQSFWSDDYALANTGGGRSGKDINTVLASIHLFDRDAGCDSMTFQPCSDKALANHRVVTDSFRSIYPINKDIPGGAAVALGRYSEDVYQGGHPWYLSNFAAAEQLYYAIYQWQKQGQVVISNTSLPFFSPLIPSIEVGIFKQSSPQYQQILTAVRSYADGYMSIAEYTPANGLLAEQFSRSDGTPLSALNLTWSYAAFVTAQNARASILPPAWGAQGATIPSQCHTGFARGPCVPPTNLTWPGRPSSTSPPCTIPSLTSVKFSVLKRTSSGESVLISGNISELGHWDLTHAAALDASEYRDSSPVWAGTVRLPTSSFVEYKYVLRSSDGSVTWEHDPNREFEVSGSCEGVAQRADLWQ